MKIFTHLILFILILFSCGDKTIKCGKGDVKTGMGEYSLYHDGIERRYLVYIPSSYDYNTRLPVVIALHGDMSNPEGMEELTHISEYANSRGVIVIYPEGSGFFRTWNAGNCCGWAVQHKVDDVGFIKEILTQTSANLCIDSENIFAVGFSNGGMMAYRLGCEASDLFKGIASVSGVMTTYECNPLHSVSIVHFHGTEDDYVPYNGGESSFYPTSFTSVSETIVFWRDKNNCSETPSIIFNNTEVQCIEYEGCNNERKVILCTVEGGGHTWPGGEEIDFFGKTTQSISASEFIFEVGFGL